MTEVPEVGFCFLAFDANGRHREAIMNGLSSVVRDYGLALVTYQAAADSRRSTLDKIKSMIAKAACVVVDGGCDADRGIAVNVAVEWGLASAGGKPVLAMSSITESLPANLRGQDAVVFPNCLQVGDPEHTRLRRFFSELGTTLLGGKTIRVFSTRSMEYLDQLKDINRLPGDEVYVGPELRAFLRPLRLEARWLEEVRRCPAGELKAQQALRKTRRAAWQANLKRFSCTDIYPVSAFSFSTWRGMGVTGDESAGFIENAIRILEEFENYSIVVVGEGEAQKFWIKRGPAGSFVVFEGWGYVEIREQRAMGGIIMTDSEAIQAFRADADRLTVGALYDRSGTLTYLHELSARQAC